MLSYEKYSRIHDFIFKGRDSTFTVTQGFNQSGKTDLNLMIAEHEVKYEYFKYFGTNQPLETCPFEYENITDLQTLIRRCKLLKKPYLFFLDELAKSANKNTAWENVDLIKELEVRRKYFLHILGAGIGEIDRRILSPLHLDVYIEKTSLTSAVLHHIQRRTNRTLPLWNIPKTNIKFKEHTATLFTPKPIQETESINDLDVRIALQWAKGEAYTGELSKPSYYDQIRRGIKKLSELAELGS